MYNPTGQSGSKGNRRSGVGETLIFSVALSFRRDRGWRPGTSPVGSYSRERPGTDDLSRARVGRGRGHTKDPADVVQVPQGVFVEQIFVGRCRRGNGRGQSGSRVVVVIPRRTVRFKFPNHSSRSESGVQATRRDWLSFSIADKISHLQPGYLGRFWVLVRYIEVRTRSNSSFLCCFERFASKGTIRQYIPCEDRLVSLTRSPLMESDHYFSSSPSSSSSSSSSTSSSSSPSVIPVKSPGWTSSSSSSSSSSALAAGSKGRELRRQRVRLGSRFYESKARERWLTSESGLGSGGLQSLRARGEQHRSAECYRREIRGDGSTHPVVPLGLLSGPPSRSTTFFLLVIVVVVFIFLVVVGSIGIGGLLVTRLVAVLGLGEIASGRLGATLGSFRDDVGFGDGSVHFGLFGQRLVAQLLPVRRRVEWSSQGMRLTRQQCGPRNAGEPQQRTDFLASSSVAVTVCSSALRLSPVAASVDIA